MPLFHSLALLGRPQEVAPAVPGLQATVLHKEVKCWPLAVGPAQGKVVPGAVLLLAGPQVGLEGEGGLLRVGLLWKPGLWGQHPGCSQAQGRGWVSLSNSGGGRAGDIPTFWPLHISALGSSPLPSCGTLRAAM